MKILKSIISFVAYFLAFIAIVISIGSAICKFTDLPKDSFIQIFGYITFYWILVLSAVVLILFLLIRNFRVSLLYLGVLILFTLFLDDFSLHFMHHRKPDHYEAYDSINVAAYNIKYYAYGIENITEFIKESDYDVLLLSESVLTTEKLDYLKRSLPAYSILTDNGHDLSILSKYPVLDYKIIELPTYLASLSSSNDPDNLKASGIHRSFVHAIINVNGTPVNVLSIRLIAGRSKDKSIKEEIRWGKYLLTAQNEELSVFINYLKTLKGPVIFGGDLNVSPNTEIIRRINHYAEDTFLDDHAFGSYTFKVSFPTMRLDYLFHSKDVILKKSEVVKVKTVLSDHFPIRAEFLIPGSKVQAIR
jgi:endonuclease/exonuclease/phosphatase family metal-dependent hydrolase